MVSKVVLTIRASSSLQHLLASSAAPQSYSSFIVDSPVNSSASSNKVAPSNSSPCQQSNINITGLLNSSHNNVFNNNIRCNQSNSIQPNCLVESSPKTTSNMSKVNNTISNKTQPNVTVTQINNFNSIGTGSYTNIGGFNPSLNSSCTSGNTGNSSASTNVQIINQTPCLPTASSNSAQIIASAPSTSLLHNGQVLSGARLINTGGHILPQSLVNAGTTGLLNTSQSTIVPQAAPVQNTIQFQNSIVHQNATTSKNNNSSKNSANHNNSKGGTQTIKTIGSVNAVVPAVNSVTQSPNVMLQQFPVMGGNVILNNSQQNSNIKPILQTPSGQLIHLVGGNNRIPSVVGSTPKLIQPKQPQLLPKPIGSIGAVAPSNFTTANKSISSGGVIPRPMNPTPTTTTSPAALSSSVVQPTSATLVALPGSNNSVLGNTSSPTVLTSAANNNASSGSLILNGNLIPNIQNNIAGLQSGLQQPVIIQQPNGIQILCKPAAQPIIINAQPQVLLNPNQAVQATNVPNTKTTPQQTPTLPPQAFMIPGANGQAPTFVLPQGITSTQNLGGAQNIVGAAPNRNIAPTQGPFYRILPQQAPLVQQINTPSGPQLLVIPNNNGGLSLSSGAVLGGAVRQLTPQLQTPTLQLGTQQIQVPGQPTLQLAPSVSVATSVLPSASISIASSTDSLIPRNNEVSNNSTRSVVNPQASSSTSDFCKIQTNKPQAQFNQQQPEPKKKKSKKKKKEPKSPVKRNSINLNDILKETGILGESFSEDHEFQSINVADDISMPVAGCSGVNDINPSIAPSNSVDNNFSISNPVSFSIVPLTSECISSMAPSNNIVITSNNSAAVPSNSITQPSSSNVNVNTFISIPNASSYPTNISHAAMNSSSTASQLNSLNSSNVISLTGGVTPQVLGNKMQQTPQMTPNIVATLDAQGKIIYSAIKAVPQVVPTSNPAPLMQPSNGLLVNMPSGLQMQSELAPANQLLNHPQIQTMVVSTPNPVGSNPSVVPGHKGGSIILSEGSQASWTIVNDKSTNSKPTKNTNTNASSKANKSFGAEITKVVQNTQLFKALQPLGSNSDKVVASSNKVPINSLSQDGSVIIGCQSFKPTSTGYGINKAQIVPVNTIVANSSQSFSVIPSSSNNTFITSSSILTSPPSLCSPNTASGVTASTPIKVVASIANASNINNVIKTNVISFSPSSNSSKTKRHQRTKKKKTEEESVILSSPPSFSNNIVPQKSNHNLDAVNLLSPIGANKVELKPILSPSNQAGKLIFPSNGLTHPPIAVSTTRSSKSPAGTVKILQTTSASPLILVNSTATTSSPMVNVSTVATNMTQSPTPVINIVPNVSPDVNASTIPTNARKFIISPSSREVSFYIDF